MNINANKLLKNVNLNKVKLPNGKTVRQTMEQEIKRLYDCIQKYIDLYYTSYTPSQYVRTNKFKNAMVAEDFVNARWSGNHVELSIKFIDELSYHNSNNGQDVYVPLLINDGWKHKGWTGGEDHYHQYSGFHFLEKGINEFNATNTLGLQITLNKEWNSTLYEERVW